MNGAALRADAGRRGDPLAAALALVQRAAAAGRPLSLFERAQVRQHVREHEAEAGRTLDAEHAALVMQAGLLHEAGERIGCRQRLDKADVLAAIDDALSG